MTPKQIGILSFAHPHADSFAASLRGLPSRAAIAAIYDDDTARGRAAADRHAPDAFCRSLDEFLENDLDGVILCSPNARHLEHLSAVAPRVSHVLLEKPVEAGLETARKAARVAHEHRCQVLVAFPCRYSPSLQMAKARVEAGDLGRLIGVCATNQGTMPGGWFPDRRLSGGGAIIDHVVHVADLWNHLLQDPVAEVYAEASTRLHAIDTEDCAILSVRFRSGAIGTLDCSWSRPESHPIWGNVTLGILGERANLDLDLFSQNISLSSNASGKMEWVPCADDLYGLLLEDFVRIAGTHEPSPIPIEDGNRALEVALAAYRSVETGEPVSLPLE